MVSTKNVPATPKAAPWLMLAARSLLFLFFQAVFAGFFFAFGNESAWEESGRWWVQVATLANVSCIILLTLLMRGEGGNYFDLLRFSRPTLKTDLLWLLGVLVIGLPVAALPMNILSTAIFGDTTTATALMFRPIPGWALGLGVLFPLTIAFAELPTYFGYVMPRLALKLKNAWLAWLLAALFLAGQHMALPLLLDGRFILWRLTMYLPFALFAGLVLKLRPQMMPYMVVIHALMDFSALAVYLTV